MAQGLFSQGTTSVARPTAPTVTSAQGSNTTDLIVSYTPSVYGPALTSYIVTPTATDGGQTISPVTTTATTVTFTSLDTSFAKSYTFGVQAQNTSGVGKSGVSNTSTVAVLYSLAVTANSTQNYTVPTGRTKLSSIIIGPGGSGGSGASAPNGGGGAGGGGGGSGAIVEFEEHTVSGGGTVALTIGDAGGTSILAYNATTLGTANSGAAGSAGSGGTAGAGGAGGSGSSNVTSASVISGVTGGSGANGTGGAGFNSPQASIAGSAGGTNATSITFSSTSGALVSPYTNVVLGSGGGGSSGSYGYSPSVPNGAVGGTNGGQGGKGAQGGYGSPEGAGANAGTAGTVGGGGGGGAGGSRHIQGNTQAATGGGSGGSGRILVFVR
jgi:hypothetical protein